MSSNQAALKAFVVEDSPVIRENLVSTLQELTSVQVIGAVETQRDAIARLTDTSMTCDLVIIDIVLKDGTGFDVLANPAVFRERRKFIVLTNYATGAIRRRCSELGVDRVFDKSNDIEELVAYCQHLSARP